ncbi:MAG: sulfite exporter TauE/SafE family protein [Solirubrobacterales bacterium]
MPDMPRTLKLALIGTAGGVFSGLLGVGGGSLIVPLLIVWLGYGAREAAGTSMMAIVVIAAVAVSLQGIYGNVDPANAALVGLPAIGGAVAGTALQQRISERAIALLFAGLLVVVAAKLIVS